MKHGKRSNTQLEKRPRPIVPYVEDPTTGEIRIPAHIETKLKVFVNGQPIRDKVTLVKALLCALEAGLIESVVKTAQEAIRRRDS